MKRWVLWVVFMAIMIGMAGTAVFMLAVGKASFTVFNGVAITQSIITGIYAARRAYQLYTISRIVNQQLNDAYYGTWDCD